jgi:dTDP-4-amino-4,6-dideoxygalactose transaminase
MRRLDEFVTKRLAIARRYDELLSDLPVLIPWQHADSYSSLHLYVIRLDLSAIIHLEVFERLRMNGIGINLHYIPVYRQPYYARMGFSPSDFPEAERYYAEAISLPIYPGLTEEQQLEVVRWLINPIGHQTIF